MPCSAACRGLGTLHVTPPLNPLPRGGDSVAEAAVRVPMGPVTLVSEGSGSMFEGVSTQLFIMR